MYILYRNNSLGNYIRGLGQGFIEMLSKKYHIVSMNAQPIPDLTGMWRDYSEAIVRSEKIKTTVANAKMGLVDVTGSEDNSKNLENSILEEGTEFALLSVHVNAIGVSMGLMLVIIVLICIFRYLKVKHIQSCWSRCCRRKTILISADGTMAYLNKNQRNSVISGSLTMIEQQKDDVNPPMSNAMRMEEIRNELRIIKEMQETEVNTSSSDIEYNERRHARQCPKAL